jgi:hypothetical protein
MWWECGGIWIEYGGIMGGNVAGIWWDCLRNVGECDVNVTISIAKEVCRVNVIRTAAE